MSSIFSLVESGRVESFAMLAVLNRGCGDTIRVLELIKVNFDKDDNPCGVTCCIQKYDSAFDNNDNDLYQPFMVKTRNEIMDIRTQDLTNQNFMRHPTTASRGIEKYHSPSMRSSPPNYNMTTNYQNSISPPYYVSASSSSYNPNSSASNYQNPVQAINSPPYQNSSQERMSQSYLHNSNSGSNQNVIVSNPNTSPNSHIPFPPDGKHVSPTMGDTKPSIFTDKDFTRKASLFNFSGNSNNAFSVQLSFH